jgi:hypothetical protein
MSSPSWFLLDTCILAEKVAPCFIPVCTHQMGQSTTLCRYKIHLVWCHMNIGHQILYHGLQLFSKWKTDIVNFSSSVKLQWLMLSTWSLIRYHWSPFLKVRHFEVGTNMVGCLSIHSTCAITSKQRHLNICKGSSMPLLIPTILAYQVKSLVCSSEGNSRGLQF